MRFKRTRTFLESAKDVLSEKEGSNQEGGSWLRKGEGRDFMFTSFDLRPALLFSQPISSTSNPLWVSGYSAKSELIRRERRKSSLFNRLRGVTPSGYSPPHSPRCSEEKKEEEEEVKGEEEDKDDSIL